jgi:acetolactate synthase-1/2/3 large subunit
VPILIVPQGFARRIAHIDPNYSAVREMRGVAKSAEPITVPSEVPNVLRRAFSRLRNGRGGPCIVEVPTDLWAEEIGELDYTPAYKARSAPDPQDVRKAVQAILAAKRPVIYAGTGVHWAEAWPQLRKFAELLGAPVTTSLGGKSSFPENHPLSLGSGGAAVPKTVHHFITHSDLIVGIGCSFTETSFGIKFPKGKKFIQSTVGERRAGGGRASWRCRADAGSADQRAVADHPFAARRLGGGEGNRRSPRRFHGRVEAAVDLQRDPDQPVSRDLGTDAHGGPQEHHHHP